MISYCWIGSSSQPSSIAESRAGKKGQIEDETHILHIMIFRWSKILARWIDWNGSEYYLWEMRTATGSKSIENPFANDVQNECGIDATIPWTADEKKVLRLYTSFVSSLFAYVETFMWHFSLPTEPLCLQWMEMCLFCSADATLVFDTDVITASSASKCHSHLIESSPQSDKSAAIRYENWCVNKIAILAQICIMK